MKKIVLISCLCGIHLIAFSQTNIVANQFNSWWTYSGNHKISDKWSIHTLYSHRRNNFVNYLQQSLIRVGLNYHVDKSLVLTGGGDWVITYPYGEQPIGKTTTTYRIFEQLVLKNKINRFYFKHRYKIEQQHTDLGNKYKTSHRFRYRLGINIPITKKEMGNNTLFVAFFDEFFLNFGKNANGYNFNQNWSYFGIGYKFNKASVQLGYMNQYLPKSDGIRTENNHTLSVSIGYSLDFRKSNID
jgi:hypothetical protein